MSINMLQHVLKSGFLMREYWRGDVGTVKFTPSLYLPHLSNPKARAVLRLCCCSPQWALSVTPTLPQIVVRLVEKGRPPSFTANVV